MLGNVSCYGRMGSQITGAPHVTELVQRTTEGLAEASKAFGSTYDRLIQQGVHPWSAPAADLTLLHTQRLVQHSWESATAFLDAIVTTSLSVDDLSSEEYRVCDVLCDEAVSHGLAAVKMQATVAQGTRPPNARIIGLKQTGVNGLNYAGSWFVVVALVEGVMSDLMLLEQGLPAQMQRLHASLVERIKPQLDLFCYLHAQWSSATSVSNRQQIVRDVIPLADPFYRLLQQLWAPYLLGAAYVGPLKSAEILGPLNLGIDPWLITDPTLSANLAANQESCRQLAEFWKTVADPRQVIAVQTELTEAVRAGALSILGGQSVKIAPWFPQYRVVRPVSINGKDLNPGQKVTLHPRGSSGKRVIDIRVY